jgi:hypothetical protein
LESGFERASWKTPCVKRTVYAESSEALSEDYHGVYFAMRGARWTKQVYFPAALCAELAVIIRCSFLE